MGPAEITVFIEPVIFFFFFSFLSHFNGENFVCMLWKFNHLMFSVSTGVFVKGMSNLLMHALLI